MRRLGIVTTYLTQDDEDEDENDNDDDDCCCYDVNMLRRDFIERERES